MLLLYKLMSNIKPVTSIYKIRFKKINGIYGTAFND